MQLRALPARLEDMVLRSVGDFGLIHDDLSSFSRAVAIRADSDRAASAASARSSWSSWAQHACSSQQSKGHRFLKQAGLWEPTSVVRGQHGISSAPADLLLDNAEQFEAIWEPAGSPYLPAGCADFDPLAELLPIPDAAALQEVSRAYAAASAVSLDGLHMKHPSLVAFSGAAALALVLALMELIGELPLSVSWVVMALLAKPAGGFRPIGIFP